MEVCGRIVIIISSRFMTKIQDYLKYEPTKALNLKRDWFCSLQKDKILDGIAIATYNRKKNNYYLAFAL